MAAIQAFDSAPQQKRLTAKERRQLKRKGLTQENGNSVEVKSYRFELNPLEPLTNNQSLLWNMFNRADMMMLDGYPGTGKTFCSLYLALKQVQEWREGSSGYQKVLVVRSSVQTRNQGHLPGDAKEKMAEFESVYGEMCGKLFGRKDAYQVLKSRGEIAFASTSFLRGISLEDTIVIVDECQSMNYHELRTVLTRLGDNCKIVFCGDETQDDLKSGGMNRNDKSGMAQLRMVMLAMHRPVISFGANDIVRSAMIKDFILAEEKLKQEGRM